jgi:hypothetical protein
MKIRTGFVSNSSSSSFIVIGKGEYAYPKWGEVLTSDRNLGEIEFGWGPARLFKVGDRVNFAFLQTTHSKKNGSRWLEMLEEVIKEHSGVSEIIWKIKEDYGNPDENWGYIDHQSSSAEGMNVEMFDSKETLRSFLFREGSHITLDNDNH